MSISPALVAGAARMRAEQADRIAGEIEEVPFLRTCGESWFAIAARFGIKPPALEKRLYRAGLPELASECRTAYRATLPTVYCGCGRPVGRLVKTDNPRCRSCVMFDRWANDEQYRENHRRSAQARSRPRLADGRWAG